MKNNQQYELEEGEEISSEQESSQFIVPKKAGRTDICAVCRKSLAKYTCPKCKDKTCGLICNKKHKQLRSCSGLTDPTEYITMDKFTQQDAKKDFGYLKEMIDHSDKVKKCLTGVTIPTPQPKRFKILRMNAKKLHNINLYHGPSIMERHRENISFYYVKTQQIYWVYELSYYKGQKQYSKVITMPISDNTKITEIITKTNYLCKQLLQKGINTLKSQQFTAFFEQKVQDNKKGVIKRQFQFSTDQLISKCLKNFRILEFPTINLVHKTLRAQYLQNRRQQIKLTSRQSEKELSEQ